MSIGARTRGRVRMRLHYDGEPTEGLLLVERLLIEGHRDETPLDRRTAESAMEALELFDLPWVFGEMVEGGERLAEQIHSQAARGLQEIVQNAQDQGAQNVRFALRRRGGASELLIAHDGAPVYLHDVVSMAYPLLSGSRKDAEKIGRFGIGLKTLNQFGDRLEVHCPPLPGFEIQGGHIRRVRDVVGIPGFWDPDARQTLFLLRLKDDRFDLAFFREWIGGWNASSLVFLRRLRSIALVDLRARRPLIRHALEVTKETDVNLAFSRARDAKRVELREVGSKRRWTVYRAHYPVPRHVKRINKALGSAVELAVATSNQRGDSRLYAGLPLEEPSSLPFSCAAPFDINVDRTELLGNGLNEWLLARLGELVAAAAEDSFGRRPKDGWRWIPLSSEAGGTRDSWLRAQLSDTCHRIRKRVTARVRIQTVEGAEAKLSELLVETSPLESLFDTSDLERLDFERLPTWRRESGTKRALPARYRDIAGRWRDVLEDTKGCRTLTVKDALVALRWPDEKVLPRGGEWLVRLTSAALDEDASDSLFELPCLLLEGATARETPSALSASGRLLVSSLPESGLAAMLQRADRLSPAFGGRGEAARQVRKWLTDRGVLHERVTDALVLEALANADGEAPVDLSADVELVRRLRNSFEQLPAKDRERLGPGVGRNIKLAGFEYDARGRGQPLAVVPADAYIPYKIEKVEGWPTAAGKTPGIRWLDDAYAGSLRSRRDTEGPIKRQGALAFFRGIGAAVAPRLHPGLKEDRGPHAVLPRRRLTAQQLDELAELPKARTLRDDWDSPDLAAVLRNLTAERSVKERRKRSRALFLCLQRAWNQQYAGRETAIAAHHYFSWYRDGDVSATWVGRLASEPWLSTRERKFTPKPPRELAVLSEASFEIEGERPERYAYEIGPEDADSPLLEAIGVEGKPGVETIVGRLYDLRHAEADGVVIDQRWVDRCYQALSAYCPGGRHENDADISRASWRAWFGTTSGRPGLLRSQGRWLSIPDVRRGAYLGPRLAWVDTPAALWEHLDVPQTDASDCRSILEALAAEKADDIATEVLVLRRLIALSGQRGLKKKLAGAPVRTYQGWSKGKTPVYTIRNRSLAEEVGAQWSVWRLPIALDEALPLVELLAITLLTDDHFEPDVATESIAATDLQADFPVIVTRLRNYLLLHHAALHAQLTPEQWQALAEAGVALGSGWAVKVRAAGRRPLRIQPRAHVFREPPLFCALDDDDAGQHDAGGHAIASYLLGEDGREEDRAFIALAWESAFRRREEREDTIDVDAPTSEVSPDGGAMPAWLRRRGTTKPSGKTKVRKPRRREKEEARQLVDLDELDVSAIKATVASRARVGKFRHPPKKKLVNPNGTPRRTKPPATGTRAGDQNYTATDREDVGFAIAEAYLQEVANLELDDIRDQGNVGADAVDREKDIWVELKTAGRDRDDTIKLERSEAMRAKEKGDRYWLVLVWNLEKPRTPELLIVQNPLARLDAFLGSGIKLVGLDELAGGT